MVNSDSPNQERHQAIVQFLKELDPSQYYGLSVRDKELFAPEVSSALNSTQIRLGVIAFTDVLNIRSGSAGTHNLYQLLEAYLLDEEKRKEINRIIGR